VDILDALWVLGTIGEGQAPGRSAGTGSGLHRMVDIDRRTAAYDFLLTGFVVPIARESGIKSGMEYFAVLRIRDIAEVLCVQDGLGGPESDYERRVRGSQT